MSVAKAAFKITAYIACPTGTSSQFRDEITNKLKKNRKMGRYQNFYKKKYLLGCRNCREMPIPYNQKKLIRFKF